MLWYSWINPKTLHLGVKRRVLEPKSLPPTTQKPGCDIGCGWWIQISTLQNHSLWLWWENGRVEMLWIAQVSSNSLNLGVTSGQGPSQLDPTCDWKTHCGDHYKAHIPILTLQNHSIYLSWDIGRVDMLWNSRINPKTLHLGVKRRVLELKSLPPTTQKPGCGVGCGWWIQISTLRNHSLYLWWENGRVEMLWIAPISPNSLNLGVKSGKQGSQLWTNRRLKNTLWLPF